MTDPKNYQAKCPDCKTEFTMIHVEPHEGDYKPLCDELWLCERCNVLWQEKYHIDAPNEFVVLSRPMTPVAPEEMKEQRHD